MNYPTIEQVNAADHYQICSWWRFLGSPGLKAINEGKNRDECEKIRIEENAAMNRIGERLKEFGGFTPEISKSLGW